MCVQCMLEMVDKGSCHDLIHEERLEPKCPMCVAEKKPDNTVPWSTIDALVDNGRIDRSVVARLVKGVAKVSGVDTHSCIVCGCEFEAERGYPDEHGRISWSQWIVECPSEACAARQCVMCQALEQDHMRMTCRQFKASSGRPPDDEEGATFAEMGVARCPRCDGGGVKDGEDESCNVVRCYDCRIYYCYLCHAECDSTEFVEGDKYHARANGHFTDDKDSPCYPCLFMPRKQWLKEGGMKRNSK